MLGAQALLLQHLEFPWLSPRPATLILSLCQKKGVMAWTKDARGSICLSLHWLTGCFLVALWHLPHPQLFWTERAPLFVFS